MLEVYVKQIPEQQRSNLKARVIGPLKPLVPHELSEAFSQDLTKIAQAGGGKFQDRNRYFFESIDDGMTMTHGTYVDFVAAFKIFQAFQQNEKFPNVARAALNSPQIRTLGLQNLLITNEGSIVFGRRGGSVQTAKGLLCLPAGGLMPDFYDETSREEPNIYLASQREIADELGIDVNTADISCPAFVRDNEGSPNVSILFEARIGHTKDEILSGYDKARDKFEHDQILFFRAEDIFHRLKRGDYNFERRDPPTPMVGASIGALLDFGRREQGEAWYEKAKSALYNNGVEVIEDI